jgi:hypothetical protein
MNTLRAMVVVWWCGECRRLSQILRKVWYRYKQAKMGIDFDEIPEKSRFIASDLELALARCR